MVQADLAGIVAGKKRQSDTFWVVFRLEISPLMTGIVANIGYRVEEEEEGKILGQVSRPKVAGRPRNGEKKNRQR